MAKYRVKQTIVDAILNSETDRIKEAYDFRLWVDDSIFVINGSFDVEVWHKGRDIPVITDGPQIAESATLAATMKTWLMANRGRLAAILDREDAFSSLAGNKSL